MEAPASDYTYDVFFSYKRHELTLAWTKGVRERIEFWLGEELNREARLFVDEESIEVGERWPEKLKEALRLSRCMVAVWSPSYFQSSWCVSEWESFRAREKQLKMASHGLIAPLRFHDGEHFPPDARDVQWTDVSKYTCTTSAFWTTERAIELEDVLKAFAQSVAKMVRAAPSFDAAWPIVEAHGFPVARIGLAKL